MLQGLFGKDNDMLIWIVVIFFLLGFNEKDGLFGGGGHKDGLFGDNMIIWIVVILFFLLGDDKDKHHHDFH